MIEAVIFDMDGVLLDSEPFWQAGEIEVFQRVGIQLTHEDTIRTMGKRIDKIVDYWFAQKPWPTPPEPAEVTDQIVQYVVDRVKAEVEPRPGVYHALDFFKQKQVPLAIASSSPLRLIEAIIDTLKITDYFDLLWSAEFETYGKPHPGVYLTTAQQLGIEPMHCLVIEDSFRGMLAAKSAEMICIAVPDITLKDDPRLSINDMVLNSLEAIDERVWEQLNT